jgi:hypothetical protein
MTLLIVYLPVLNRSFRTAPLTLTDWLLPLTAGAICLVVYEFRKRVSAKKR